MKQAILIFEWNRPKYLRICLDSLAQVAERESWPILLSIDGPADAFKELFPRCADVKAWPDHVGNLWHVTRSLGWVTEKGFDRVLFMDGDVILRRDALQNLPEKGPTDLLIGMSSSPEPANPHISWFSPQANIVNTADLVPVLDWVKRRSWVGMKRAGTDTIMRRDYPGYDAVYLRYMIKHGLTTLYRDRSYAGHIGVCGVDCHWTDIEAEMFQGPPEQWLSNAIRLFDHSRSAAFMPPDFSYL